MLALLAVVEADVVVVAHDEDVVSLDVLSLTVRHDVVVSVAGRPCLTARWWMLRVGTARPGAKLLLLGELTAAPVEVALDVLIVEVEINSQEVSEGIMPQEPAKCPPAAALEQLLGVIEFSFAEQRIGSALGHVVVTRLLKSCARD